ncbi:response regulator transcription factor [Niabella soli]|uniref:LuxR family transcriptional regulator n=1 Tax=Niabella soli DSM 19437 TaxID=929713 RepID=W0F4V6_9BACT|nr:response regulator transcription factor [Niabella soli]AHF18110.1 hypothetical protein NIASO_20700 [Niabella soli DSM 19437]
MPPAKPYRILIADDQPHCREALFVGLQGRPALTICGNAQNGRELVELTGKLEPDVIITDIRMPEMDGIEATRIIKEIYPHIKVLALSQYQDYGLIMDMVSAGASGYILKDESGDNLELAINTIMTNSSFFCSAITIKLQEMVRNGVIKNRLPVLSPGFFAAHEKEVLLGVCQGKKSPQIAAELGLSCNTIQKYRQNLMDKTGTNNNVSLSMFAVLHGIYTP